MVESVGIDGTRKWLKDGKLHREDGPAIIYPNGTEVWYLNGHRHRVCGPAITTYNGTQVWYKDGKMHREDGPSLITKSGAYTWWFNGVAYTFIEWCKLVKISGDDKLHLALIYGTNN